MIGLFNFPLRQQPDGTLVSSGPISAPVLSPSQQVPILPKLSDALGSVMAQVADAEINLIGDSWTYGYYGSSLGAMPLSRSLKSLLPNALNPAIGWQALGSNAANRDPSVWTIGTGWGASAYMGFGIYSGVNATNPAGSLVFAAEDVADTFDVMFVGVSGYGTAQIQATGGSAVPVSLNVSPAQIVIGTCSAASLAAGNSVSITGTGQMIVLACRARNSTKKQLYVNNFGVGTSLTSGWAGGSTGYSSVDALAKTAPCLTIMQLGMNEALNNVAASTYISSLRTAISKNPATGDLILAGPGRANPTANSGNVIARLNEYQPLVKALAAELGVRFVDVADIVGEYSAATFADNYHLKKQGYPKVALAYHRTMFL